MNMRCQTRVAAKIRIRVPDTPIGRRVSLEGSTNIMRLAIEPTISSVQEHQVTISLMVNTTGTL